MSWFNSNTLSPMISHTRLFNLFCLFLFSQIVFAATGSKTFTGYPFAVESFGQGVGSGCYNDEAQADWDVNNKQQPWTGNDPFINPTTIDLTPSGAYETRNFIIHFTL